jgi:WD40 repeat protein
VGVVFGVSFSPDGQRLASTTGEASPGGLPWKGEVKVWNARTGETLWTVKRDCYILSPSFSPDGQRLAVVENGTDFARAGVQLLDARTGQDLEFHDRYGFLSVNFSPDGKRLASDEGRRNRTVKVWDAATFKDLLTLRGHRDQISCVSFSPDGQRLASGSDDNTVKVWDAQTGKNLLTLKGHVMFPGDPSRGQKVYSLSFDPDALKFNTFLCSKQKYGDFELKFQVKMTGKSANSGVQIRSHVHDKKTFAVTGPQCGMGQEDWGSLYGENFGGMMQAADAKLVKKIVKENDWNDYYIKAVGKHITIKLNGETTVDGDFPKIPDSGIIAWQLHAGPAMEVSFRNIQFTEIAAAKK